jgi:hypothetical protein
MELNTNMVPVIRVNTEKIRSGAGIEQYFDDEFYDIFNRHIIYHIEECMNGNIKHNLLCYFIDEQGNKYTSVLERDSWGTSLATINQYFIQIQEYETCNKIKKLISKL